MDSYVLLISLLLLTQFYGGHATPDALMTPLIVEDRRNYILVPTGNGDWQAVDPNGSGELVTDDGWVKLADDPLKWDVFSKFPPDSTYDTVGHLRRPSTSDDMPRHGEYGGAYYYHPGDYEELLKVSHSRGNTRTSCLPQSGNFPDEHKVWVTGRFGSLIDCAEKAIEEFRGQPIVGVVRAVLSRPDQEAPCVAYLGNASDWFAYTILKPGQGPMSCIFRLFLLPGQAVGNEASFAKVSMGAKASAQECADAVETAYSDSNGISWNSATGECLAVWAMEGVEPLYGGTSVWKSAFLWNAKPTTTTATSTTEGQKGNTNVGVIVGSAAGGVVGLAAMGLLGAGLYRRKKREENVKKAIENAEFGDYGEYDDFEEKIMVDMDAFQ